MLRTAFAAFALVAFAASSHAGVLGSALTGNGEIDRLESTGGVAAFDGAGSFSVGDVIYGFSALQNVTPDIFAGGSATNLAPNHVVALFAAEIVSVPGAGAGSPGVYELAAPTTGNRLFDLLDPSLQPLLTGIEDDAAFLLLSAAGPASDPVNNAIAGDLSHFTAADYSFELAGGLAPDGFFEFNGVPSFGTGQQVAGANVLSHDLGSGVSFVDIPFASPFGTGAGGAYDLTIPIALVGPAIPPASGNGWTFSVQSTIDINIVPEPTAFLAFAGIGLAGLARRRRRA
ncbi:MAG: PEP-CTERM sorting domain-containing protein [Planctomycetota bacterium]